MNRGGGPTRRFERGRARRGAAFTLIELLIVIGIMVVLAVSSVPAIRSLSQTNKLAAGSRQMLDELSYARQLAVGGRRTVYMLFLPAGTGAHADAVRAHTYPLRLLQEEDLTLLTNLVTKQLRGYAIFSWRSAGDQPGRRTPTYLTDWRALPDGMLFATNKFVDLSDAAWLQLANTLSPTNRPLPRAWFPFPSANSPPMRLPYIAFEPTGQLHYEGGFLPQRPGESIAIARGSVFYPQDAQGRPVLTGAPDVVETPPGNRQEILVNWLTGKARALNPELP